MDPDQTAPIRAVSSGYTLVASLLNSSVMLGNYLQQTTFSDAFFLGALRVKKGTLVLNYILNNQDIHIKVYILLLKISK